MKKFTLGFVIGTIVMVLASQAWDLMPTFLGGRWDVTTPNPITSNPFTLWCDQLTSSASGLGTVAVTVTQNSRPVSDLTVNLSVKKPPAANYPGAKPGEFMIPEKACFVGTNSRGVGEFTKVPVGTVYLFFNNDPAAYPKRFGQPNFSITEVGVKSGQTSTAVIELSSKN